MEETLRFFTLTFSFFFFSSDVIKTPRPCFRVESLDPNVNRQKKQTKIHGNNNKIKIVTGLKKLLKKKLKLHLI
jgi:hypothetical protein